MGNRISSYASTVEEQLLFVKFVEYETVNLGMVNSKIVVFQFFVGFQRYHWKIYKRFSEVYELYRHIQSNYRLDARDISFPAREYQFWKDLDERTIIARGAFSYWVPFFF